MEGHRRRLALVVLAIALAASAAPASAYEERTRAAATDGDGSVELLFTRERDGRVAARPKRGRSSCRWRSEVWQSTVFVPDLPAQLLREQPSPEHQLYVVSCGTYVGTRWVGPRDFVDPNVEALLERARREVGVLPAAIEVRPGNRGVTGVPSLFWVTGYDGETIERRESAFGLTVTVRFRLTHVEWDFGDGSPVERYGLGEAWPKRSSVRHNYRSVSGAAPYVVRATLHFEPSVEGADAGDLDPIEVTFRRPYVVGQIQAVGR